MSAKIKKNAMRSGSSESSNDEETNSDKDQRL